MKHIIRYRASYKEPEWFTKESEKLLEEYEKTSEGEYKDLEAFIRMNASHEYIKELDNALSVL